MDYRKNLKYFKSTDTHFYIGLPLAIIGGILFVLAYIFWIYLFWYQDMIAIALIVAGAVIAFVPRSLRSSEKDIDAVIASQTENYAKESAEALGLTSSLARNMPPVVIGGYSFDHENALVRKGKDDSKFRSDKYIAAALLFTKQGFCVSTKEFSLTEEHMNETVSEFHYSDLANICVENGEHILANGVKIKSAALVIVASDGKMLRIPVKNTAAIDKLCGDINYMIDAVKKSES